MKSIGLLFIIFISQLTLAQKLKHVFNESTIVHSIPGMELYKSGSIDSNVITHFNYGDTLMILANTEKKGSLNGYSGKWIKVMKEDTVGYVLDTYLSKLPAFEMNESYNYLKDYAYDAFTLVDGEDYFKLTDATRRREATFDKAEYKLKGGFCDCHEELIFSKRHSVQEIFLVLLPFNWNFYNISFDQEEYKKGEEGKYHTNYYVPREFLSFDYYLTYSKNKSGEYDYLSVYFDCEAGGGSLSVVETKSGIKATHEYGCH